jgi:dipeptidyl aminopeptidase/acylaminoacyl peptidase
MVRKRLGAFVAAASFAAASVIAQESEDLETTPLAAAFGASPAIWGLQLSPDGTQIVAIGAADSGATLARTLRLADGHARLVLEGELGESEVQWCDWANDARLLCGVRGIAASLPNQHFAGTRLIAVNADGTDEKVLMRHGREELAQFQDRVIDWLPDDPDHVLVQVPSLTGSGVSELDVNTGRVRPLHRGGGDIYKWLTDGYGVPRLFQTIDLGLRRWYVRRTPDSSWTLLQQSELKDLDAVFAPIGFAEDGNELLAYDVVDGRRVVASLSLDRDTPRRIVYMHPTFDVSGTLTLGKDRRLVGAMYIDDRPHVVFFDRRVRELHEVVSAAFPGKAVEVVDEDWNRQRYVVLVSGDTDPGTYYYFDWAARGLTKIAEAYPALAEQTLAPMREIRYPGRDGVPIPAYLTTPPGGAGGPKPAVILPHGGPTARDYWEFDYLVQFLAASGYVVLQANYRGSDGYGAEWRGEGGFRDWRRAVDDITAGVDYLVREGIADERRLCTLGWSFGGYAALMSAIEQPAMFRCIASIAGVADPRALSATVSRYVGGTTVREFIGSSDPEIGEAGSPVERAGEIEVPVLLVHATLDTNVPLEQSLRLAKALRRANKSVELVEYALADHDIRPARYRTDLLARLGAFLDANLDSPAPRTTASAR